MKRTNEIVRRGRKPMTDAEFQRAADEQIALLSALSLFVDVDAASKEERIARSVGDAAFYNKTYLPHYFSDEGAEWHPEFQAALRLYDEMVAATAQREGAKSTLIFAEIVREVCLVGLMPTFNLLVYRLDSLDKAMMYTQRILIELQHNERIKADFGLRVAMDAAVGNFTCFDPETHKRLCRIVAFGANMSLRGIVNEETRPDWIISEDVQDRDSAESEKRTKKELRRLINDARPALPARVWRFTVVGNVVCQDSAVDQLLSPKKFKAFVKLRFPAEYVDKDGVRRSSWPSRYPLELLDKVKFQIGDPAYEAEYLCKAVEVGDVFNEKRDFHQWKNLPEELDLTNTFILEQVDQALSGSNDSTAIGIFVSYTHTKDRADWNRWSDNKGRALGEGFYLIMLDCYCRYIGVDEVLDETFNYFTLWKPTEVRVDGSVDKEIVFDRFFREAEIRKGISLPLLFDKFTIAKDTRIRKIQPYMQRRNILFPPHLDETDDMIEAKKQIFRYGRGDVHDDFPDMVAAAAENLDPEYGSASTNVEML